MKPVRKSFHKSGLAARTQGAISYLFRSQLTHAQFLALRGQIIETKAWACATSSARAECFAMLRGAVEAAYASGLVVWKHRDIETGEWLPSPLPEGRPYTIDLTQSQHVWAETNRVFFEPDSEK